MTAPVQLLDQKDITATRVLVVAPHQDDESLGCGGLLAILAAHGRTIHTLFVTDGGASHLGSKLWTRSRLAARREAEAAEALSRLGLGHHPRSFMRLRDADMPPLKSPEWTAAVDSVRQLIDTFRPELMILPWRRDPHRDHQDSWRLAMAAMALAGPAIPTLEYAIWLDELGAVDDRPRAGEMEMVAVDVAHLLSVKRHAIAAHLSQTTALIADDPDGFRLSDATVARLSAPHELYARPCAG